MDSRSNEDWQIVIDGTGPHHTKGYDLRDADKIASRVIRELTNSGHRIKSAKFVTTKQVEDREDLISDLVDVIINDRRCQLVRGQITLHNLCRMRNIINPKKVAIAYPAHNPNDSANCLFIDYHDHTLITIDANEIVITISTQK